LTLKGLSVRVTGEFDPVGAPDRGTVPYFNSIKMQLQLSEGSASDAEHLAEAIKTRCLIYATLARAVPIRLEIANETNAAASHSLS
jgi:uncharacterized OsmC-like protein